MDLSGARKGAEQPGNRVQPVGIRFGGVCRLFGVSIRFGLKRYQEVLHSDFVLRVYLTNGHESSSET